MATLKADRRLYVTADRSEIVEEADPRSAFLLAAAGKNIGGGDVDKYGLRMVNGCVSWGNGAPADKAPESKMTPKPEDKAVHGPNATKSAIALAAESELDLATVEGTGKGGRIVLTDVEAAIEASGE